jgi:hypothetical protein
MSDRVKLPGFDPFINGWEAFEQGGAASLEESEAPIVMYAADGVDPELADRLTYLYSDQDLRPADLRFGMWPDASPIPPREEDDAVGVHLNTFGGRQVRYRNATAPERAALDEITFKAEELIIDALNPAHGVSIYRFGKIPTLHAHAVARERQTDGLGGLDVRQRTFIDLPRRREMRSRLAEAATPDRIDDIARSITRVLGRFTR